MTTAPLRAASALIALTALLPLGAFAAPKPLAGPTGWDHTVGATPTPQLPRAQETWKKSDGQQITYLSDGALSYDDIVGMVKKNITDNNLKPAVDKDRTCDGRRSHELEMTFGTTVVRQIIIDDAPGVTKLTYTRPQGSPPSPDAVGSLTGYCGS